MLRSVRGIYAQPEEASTTIPIVMISGGDAVGSGLVGGLTSPGGNDRIGNASPGAKRKTMRASQGDRSQALACGRLHQSRQRGSRANIEGVDLAAGPLGVQLQHLDIRSPKDFESAFRDAAKGRARRSLSEWSNLLAHRTKVLQLAVKGRLPVIYESAEEVEAGGLMSYGLNTNDSYRRAATYVEKS